LLHRLSDHSHQDINQASEMLVVTKKAAEKLDKPDSAIRNLGELVLTVFETDPHLLNHLEAKSINALAEIGDLALITEAGQMIAGLKSTDEYASHIFCQRAFTTLPKEIKARKYGSAETRRYLQKAAEFLHSANAKKSQDKETYEVMRDFFDEGYLGILLATHDDSFIQQVINSADGESNARGRLNRIMSGLDMAEAVRLAGTDAFIDFYHQIISQKQLPIYHPGRAVRQGLTEGEPQTADLRPILLAIIQSCQGLDYEDLKTISFGLGRAFFEKTIGLSMKLAAEVKPEEFVNYIKGLGVLINSWFDLKLFEGKEPLDFLEIPQTDEDRTAFARALTNLANIYFSGGESQRKQIHQLVDYALAHDELRTSFLLHLHGAPNTNTLNS